ncbi:hypothetical protein F4861DRAFT_43901 [Xylaria intraflava]|nr:hypothetical protein F4861DRAFT_43901 [Xylaria intraflava]
MATSSLSFSTPSPPGTVRTPGTPKYGYSDAWAPFSPRKSARISSRQQSTNRTPSPRSSHQPTNSSTKPSIHFSTPAGSPQKKRLPNMDSVRRASNSLTVEGAANAADALGIVSKQQKPVGATATSHATTMLPTPAKTPRKQPSAKLDAASRDVARNIFATDADIMPTPKKKAKRYTGLTLDSFRAEDMEESIEIFTDSRDRVPELDDSVENPFYGDHPVAEPLKRRSKRKSVVIPGDGRQSIEDAVRRDDGVLVVFRGKKIFRKFSDCNDASSNQVEGDEEADSDSNGQTRPHRPMTRSSIKPRLLFPPKAKGKQVATATVEDEEAVTDIEDHILNAEAEVPGTPAQAPQQAVETPEAPRFAPASPPSTGRVTRSADKSLKKAKIPSPFDSWRRSKSRAPLQGQKREGEPLAKSPAGTKRQRA